MMGINDEDDFLSGGSDFFKPKSETKSDKPITTDVINDNVEYTNIAPMLLGDGYPKEFIDLSERIRRGYVLLPKLRIEDIYSELAELTIKTSQTPTLQTINRELEKSQAAKDRITEIDIQITQCVMYKERVVELLTDAWNKFSDEKSADKRKGDTAFRLANFYIDLVRVESVQKACKSVLLNLCSLQDTLSRRITNIQLQLKLMDIGRTSMPDFDFSSRLSNADNLVSQALGYNEDKPSENILDEISGDSGNKANPVNLTAKEDAHF